jgi:penicillin-binding protein 2
MRSRLNLIIVQTLVLSLMFALFGRLFYLQIANSGVYQNAALSIQSRDIVTPAIRGAITDRTGLPMTMDRPGLAITVDRSVIDKQPDKGVAVMTRLANLLNMNFVDLWQGTRLCGELEIGKRAGCWNGSRYQPIPVTKQAAENVALVILENSDIYQGIDAVSMPVRSYPALAGELPVHLLGYVGGVSEADLADATKGFYRNENVGKSGLEYQYDNFLRGTPGIKTVIVDRKESITQTSTNTQPISGTNLITNISSRIQSAAEKALANAVKRSRSMGYRADSGAAIVLDVKNGGVLALASYPSYDPNMFQKGLTVQQAKDLFSESTGVPALNRAIQGAYAPASTFKALSVVAATKAGYNMNNRYNCPASVKVGNRDFNNFEVKSQGVINMEQAIAVSCDTIWYQIAYDEWVRDGGLTPKTNVNDYFFSNAKGFGVGNRTGIDLPDEVTGRLPDRQWKKNYWNANKDFFCNYQARASKKDLTPYLIAIAKENCTDGYIVRAGDAVNFAIGQGDTLVSPIQMATIYAAIANGGTLYKPEIARAFVTAQGKVTKEFQPEVIGKSPQTAEDTAFLHRALRAVVTRGTAAGVFAGFPIAVSGKTGTGQVLGRNANGSAKDDTSWFSSFAPSDNPQYAVVMVVSQGGFGASVSAVGVKDIYSTIFGVKGNTAYPELAVFPSSGPTRTLPTLDIKNAQEYKEPTLAIPTTSASPTPSKKVVKR